MKMKYLLYGALALVGISAFGAKKGFEINEVLPQLQTTLSAIRKLSFNGLDPTLIIDVTVKNPTNKALNFASAGAVTVTKLLVYDRNNNLIATAEPNINALSIPANGQVILKDIPITSTLTSIWQTISTGGLSTNPDDYIVQTEINALGKTVTL